MTVTTWQRIGISWISGNKLSRTRIESGYSDWMSTRSLISATKNWTPENPEVCVQTRSVLVQLSPRSIGVIGSCERTRWTLPNSDSIDDFSSIHVDDARTVLEARKLVCVYYDFVGCLSSEYTGLYSTALVGTQLWLLWPCGALYSTCSVGTRFADEADREMTICFSVYRI